MKENLNDLTSENGGNNDIHDETGMLLQSSLENTTLPDSSSPDSLDSFVKKMKSLVKQGEIEVAHYQQLKENHHGLKDEFQQLEIKYQNLVGEHKQLINLHKQMEREFQNHLQKSHVVNENLKKSEQFIQEVNTLLSNLGKNSSTPKEVVTKYFTLMDYFKFRGFRFYLTTLKIRRIHKLLEKKTREVGYEMQEIIQNGETEIAYHSFVLQMILGF